MKKLTVENLIEKLIKDYEDSVWGGVFEINKTVARKDMTNSLNKFLKQIRDELNNEFDKSLEHSEYVVVDKVFNKYLKEK